MSQTPPPPPPPPPSAAPPPPPPGAPPAGGVTPPPSERGGKPKWLIPAIVAVVVVALAGVGAFFVFGGDEASAEVVAESVTDPGADPFMSSMAVVEVAEFPSDVEAVIDANREALERDGDVLLASGTQPGLYGGSNDETVCDAATLVGFLGSHEAEAAAWAGVLGISPGEIADYVAGLTSVVLTTDTLVVNHGFANGQATPRDAVLQAGTAVMVDDTGVPRIKCGCGNPLLPPNTGSVDLGNVTGAWDGFDAQQVAVVDPGQPAESLEVVDVETGDTIDQRVGSSGGITEDDLLNLTMPDHQMCDEVVTLVDGYYECEYEMFPGEVITVWRGIEGAGPHDQGALSIFIGDFTGDGLDDGIIFVSEWGGQAGSPNRSVTAVTAEGEVLDMSQSIWNAAGTTTLWLIDWTAVEFVDGDVLVTGIYGRECNACVPVPLPDVLLRWNGAGFTAV